MTGASIAIRDLTKRFGDVTAVRGFNLDVQAGEFVSVLGQSGSGKSTVLRMIAGLEFPTSGEIYIDDESSTNLPPEARGIGMVFQDYALFPNMSVKDNIAFPLRMRGMKKDEIERRVAGVIDLVNLHKLEKRRPSQLSGGQQQRVAVARALVFDPKLLLLDEPLSALDKNLREHMKAELQALHKRVGVTVIYVTHDQSEALALSDRVVVMRDGEIEGLDSPRNLYNLPSSRYIARFIGDANLVRGRVDSVFPSGISVTSAIGSWTLPRERVRTAEAVQSGASIDVVIRPETVSVTTTRSGDPDMTWVSCDVLQVLYSGSTTLFVLRSSANGLELAARVEGQLESAVQPGQSVEAGIPHARLVAVSADAS